MALDTNVVSVGTTATRLDTAGNDTGDKVEGSSLLPYNDSSVVAYLGGSGVTASGAKKGVPIAANSYGPGIDLGAGDAVYAITASGTASIIVLEQGV